MQAICMKVLLLTGLVFLLIPSVAHAYLDPGSGSLIFQMIVAGAAGVAFAAKIFWYRIKQFFSMFRGSSDE